MSHDDFDFEPSRGLPAALPEGESLLWQGSSNWKCLALRAYHVRKVAVYFVALALCRIGFGIGNGLSSSTVSASAILVSCAFILALGCVAIGVLSLLAYLNAASTVYSITSQRIILRHGIAVPLTMNIPFTLIESAGLTMYSDGTGDIALGLLPTQRVGYLISWPHLRPGHFTHPQPSFRALADARQAAAVLATALAVDARTGAVPIGIEAPSAARPAMSSRRAAAA
jgi:Bacterial PH domain